MEALSTLIVELLIFLIIPAGIEKLTSDKSEHNDCKYKHIRKVKNCQYDVLD